jgi:hypothetical protein
MGVVVPEGETFTSTTHITRACGINGKQSPKERSALIAAFAAKFGYSAAHTATTTEDQIGVERKGLLDCTTFDGP